MKIINALLKNGWKVERKSNPSFVLPETISQRYPKLPKELTDFLAEICFCSNADETAWFLSESDYAEKSDSVFRWNEFELMELEFAEQENDSIWKAEVKDFWNNHFPFMLTLKSGYGYFAVSLCPQNYGAVVSGYEPEFTTVSEIASSFGIFLASLAAVLEGEEEADFINESI